MECSLTPFDGSDAGTPAIASVTVLNTAPVVPFVSIHVSGVEERPDMIMATDPLLCEHAEPIDADGDAVEVLIEWMVDGEVIGVGPELTSGYGAGDEVICAVSANDNRPLGQGEAATASVWIENTLPTIGALHITPDPGYADSTLTCGWDDYQDVDGDPDRSIASWSINGLFAKVGAELTGGFIGGDIVSCTVIPSDGREYGSASMTAITIANSAPTVDAVSIGPADAVYGDELTCSYTGFLDLDGDGRMST